MTTDYVVHIGFHKSGTTYLQNYLSSKRQWLLERGILFPRTAFRVPAYPSNEFASHGHAGLVRALKNHRNSESLELVDALRREIDSSGATSVLISSEIFSAPHNFEFCARGFSNLLAHGDTLRVMVYLRRQDLWFDSLYREILGWSGRRESRDFVTFFEEEGPAWLDYQARLEPWIKAAGPGQVIVRSYDDAVATNGLAADFLGCLSILESPPASQLGARQNPSLHPALVDIQRAVNTISELPSEAKARITRLLLTANEQNLGERGSLVDETLWTRMSSLYAEPNRTLAHELISGPSERFRFPERRPPVAATKQKLDFRTARALIQEISGRTSTAAGDTIDKSGSFGIVATVNETPKQTKEFINYHLNLGASYLVLCFDNPDDEVIGEYEADPRIVCVRCTDAHWETLLGRAPANMAEKLSASKRCGHEMLRGLGVEWTLALDADELLLATSDPRSILREVKDEIDLIKFKPLEAVQHPGMIEGRVFSACYFKPTGRNASIIKRIVAYFAFRRISDVVRSGYFPKANCWAFGFFGHIEGRFFVRSVAEVEEYRSHSVVLKKAPNSKGPNRISSSSFSILHFDCISYESWHSKWRRRTLGSTRAVNIGEKRKKQEALIRAAIERGGDELRHLYEQWHCWTSFQLRIGLHTGLLRTFKLPDHMFLYHPVTNQEQENGR